MNKNQLHNEHKTFLADWIAGKISDEDLQKLISEEDFTAYQKIKITMDSFESPLINVVKSYEDLQNKLHNQRTPKVIRIIPNWVYSAVASIVLLFGIFQFFNAKTEYKTSFGQTQELVLNEGTTVILNSKSRISYSKYRMQRAIYLEGEAFFSVTEKGDFTVTTPNGNIQVMGTKFNVTSQKNFIEVVCYEGKVQVNVENQQKTLTKGQAIRFLAEDQANSEIWTIEGKMPTWIDGETSFRSLPVSYVFHSLENQYDITIKVPPFNTDTLFTGSFRHDNLESALESICLPLGLKFEIKEDQFVVLSEK
jgi:ferric-dicitrate binding protein FerR (iron transport regulator)